MDLPRFSSIADLFSAIQNALSDNNRPARIKIGAFGRISSFGRPLLAVHSYHITESINTANPLRIRMVCVAVGVTLRPHDLLGQPASLEIVTDSGNTRTFSGMVRYAQEAPDDGGGVQPWVLEIVDALTLMDAGRQSRRFAQLSVIDVLETILREWRNHFDGAFDFDLKGLSRNDYPVRGQIVQWNLSDAAMFRRQCSKHGLNWYIRSEALDDGKPCHVLVVHDNSRPVPVNPAGTLRYHIDTAMQEADHITLWSPASQITPGLISGRSWDHKFQGADEYSVPSSMDFGETGNSVADAILHSQVHSLHYANDGSELSRYGDQRMEYFGMRASLVYGASASRDAAVMTWFTVRDRPGTTMSVRQPPDMYGDSSSEGGDDYVYLKIDHYGNNSLPINLSQSVVTLLTMLDWHLQLPNLGQHEAHRRYANLFIAVERAMPIRPDPSSVPPDNMPALIATVVLPDERYRNEFGAVPVMFADLGESRDDALKLPPIRVAVPSASPGYGMIHAVQDGDEALVVCPHGDADKMIITHFLHSPVRPLPAFHARQTWPENRYLSGYRTKEVAGTRANHVQHDDTPNQISVQAHCDHAHSQLNLGYLTTPRTEGKADPRGEGIELRTDESAAVRAAQGVLVSAYARLKASGQQLDVDEMLSLMQTCTDLFDALSNFSGRHLGQPLKAKLQKQLSNTLEHWPNGTNTAPEEKTIPTGVVAITGPDGIAQATEKTIVNMAGGNIDSVAMHNIQHAAGEKVLIHAAKGIGMAAHEGGIQMVAHNGDVHLQTQKGMTLLESSGDIKIVSAGDLYLMGKRILLANQDGSFIDLTADITLGTGGALQHHGASLRFEGPQTQQADKPSFSHEPFNDKYKLINKHTGKPMKNTKYAVVRAGGAVEHGVTDAEGHTHMLSTTMAVEVVDIYAEMPLKQH